MRLLERFGVLLRADVHGVMDQLEERTLLMKQHLREAELALERKQARRDALEEAEKQLADELSQGEAALAELDADVGLAMDGDQEELARYSLRRLLAQRNGVRELRARRREVSDERESLATQLDQQAPELAELRRRVRGAIASRASAEPRGLGEISIAEEEIDLELLRRRRSVSV